MKKLAITTALSGSIAGHIFLGLQLLAVTTIVTQIPKTRPPGPIEFSFPVLTPPSFVEPVKPETKPETATEVTKEITTENPPTDTPVSDSLSSNENRESVENPTEATLTGDATGSSETSIGDSFSKAIIDHATYREPRYPANALRLGVEGAVKLSITIGSNGEVLNVEILETSHSRELDNAARAAAKKWLFQAATKNGVPTQSRLEFVVQFRLGGRSSLDFG